MTVINAGAFKPTSLDQLQSAVNQCMNVPPGGGQGQVHDIRSEADLTKLQNTGQLVVTDWFAKECSQCVDFKPIFEKMATEYTDVLFCQIDINESKKFAFQYSVISMLTFKASCRSQRTFVLYALFHALKQQRIAHTLTFVT